MTQTVIVVQDDLCVVFMEVFQLCVGYTDQLMN